MANISNNVNVHDGTAVANWISQINTGGTVYDIATHHNITFVEGQGGTKTTWNGLSDIEVIIPSIADIVQTPIEFAGTVGADGVIAWNDTHKDGPKTGYLIFFTADCAKFSEAEVACEAGDMAIYDGTKWNIVSGENQVEIVNATVPTIADVNRTVVKVGAAKDVLVVEGKALSLTLDYEDLNSHVYVEPGDSAVTVNFGDMEVGEIGIKLSQDIGTPKTISDNVDIYEATKLANGDVTISGTANLVTDVIFGTFSPGAFPEVVKNTDEIKFDVTGGSLTEVENGPFLTGVSLGNVTFGGAKEGDTGAFTLVNGLSTGNGKAFLTGINGEAEAKIKIDGGFVPEGRSDAKFVKGLANGVTEVVTGINSGSFEYDPNGSTFITGLTDNVNTVVTNVSFSATNNTSVLNEAKVENHVLTFGSVNVASSVSVETTSKTFTKGGYTHTDPSPIKTSFTMGGFTKASDVEYIFDTANETTYTTTTSYYKITTPDLVPTYGGYELNNNGMTITVASDTFAVGMTEGTLPNLTSGDVKRESVLYGVVDDTSLETLPKTIRQVAADASTIELPGKYSIVSGNIGDDGVITVGAAGELASKYAEVDLYSYVTGVYVSTSARQ